MRRATVLLIELSCLLAVVVAVVAVEVADIPAQPRPEAKRLGTEREFSRQV